MEKRLTAFLDSINMKDFTGPEEQLINALHYDSRRVTPGTLFFALPGLHTDGKRFISAAIENGARAVVYEGTLAVMEPGVSYISVENCRSAMSRLASAFYDEPSQALYCIGVTGTDGKSSTVYFIHQLLELIGCRSGFLSTVRFNTGKGTESNYLRQSTPEAPEIHGLLHEMRSAGIEYAVVEATSHGLSMKTGRLADVRFTTAVLTNISHEHLEFHGSFERYRDDKAGLFRRAGTSVINLDDGNSGYFIEAAKSADARILTYSLSANPGADFTVVEYREGTGGMTFTFRYEGKEYSAALPLIGSFNIENYAAAFLTVLSAAGAGPEKLVQAASDIKPVEGRMNLISKGQSFRVIVDYAHTPGSFAKVFPLIRNRTEGKLISVFGSAGERDIEKRPIQGEIAGGYSDIVVLTDEDPRGEDRLEILRQIARGCKNKEKDRSLFIIPDRKEAIRKAYSLADPGDTVLLLGKGHEKSIIYKDGAVSWNESAVAEECLADFM